MFSIKAYPRSLTEGCGKRFSLECRKLDGAEGKTMKSTISCMKSWLIVALAAGFAVAAARGETETVDGVVWTYTISGGKASVGSGSYDGAQAVPTTTTGAIAIPASLGGYPVTSIGAYAFSSCSGLSSVTIPASVTSIGDGAFYWCSGLTSVTIPDSVMSIGAYAFSGCSLTSVTIPANVTSIEDFAFNSCSGLTTVAIPDGVTNIGIQAFAHCNLIAVSIPDSVTSIAEYAFVSCYKLASVTLSSNITSLGAGSFQWCSGLTSVLLPSSVTNIGAEAFLGCSGLTQIMVEPGNMHYASQDGVLFTKSGAELIQCPGKKTGAYTIPSSVKQIGTEAFYSCRYLTSVSIPPSVTSIGDSLFSECSGLRSVRIPSSVTNIGYTAFSGCSGLTMVVIPEGVTSIGQYSFSRCSGLETLYVPEAWMSKYVDGEFWSTYATVPGGCKVEYYSPQSLLALTESKRTFTPMAVDSQELGVVAHMDWTAQSSAAWLTVRTMSGTGYGIIAYDMTANLGNEMRTGTILVEGEGITRTFTVMQGGWSYKISDGKASVMGVEPATAAIGNLVIPSSLDGCPVTSIGPSAFGNCHDLASVTIPSSVTSIEDFAFDNCSGLTAVTIPNSVTNIGDAAFDLCRALTSVTIPASVLSIGAPAFPSCYGLTEIVVETGNRKYASKDGILFVKSGDGDELLKCPEGKTGAYTIPDSVTFIWSGAFSGCSSLTSVTIPDSVTHLDLISVCDMDGTWTEQAFYRCSHLKTLHVPVSWEGTGMLTNVELPSGCRVVYDVPQSPLRLVAGEGHFTADAASNQELGVKATVAWTAESSATWVQLKTVSGSGNGTIVYDVAAYTTTAEARIGTITVTGGGITRTFTITQGVLWNYDIADGKVTVRGAEQEEGDLVIPSSLGGCPVTRIGDCAWDWCPQLTSVTLPATLTDIDEWAFSDCSGLAMVTIPAGVTNIGVGVFAMCSGLTEIKVETGNKQYADKDGVLFTRSGDKLLQCPGGKAGAYTVPSGVKGIRGSAFEGCIALTSVTLPESVTVIGASVFYYCNALKILYVPESWKTKYVEGKYWSEYALVPEGCKIVYCGPDGPEPVTTTGVPYTWLSEYGLGDGTPAGFETAADATAANGINTVAECYVAGLNPTNKSSTFTATLAFTNGHPVVTWTPDLNENDTRTDRSYVVEGRPSMTNAWGVTNASSRFFRVLVKMPE